MSHVSRRSFLQAAAGLIVAISLPRTADASEATVAADSVDGYLAISPSRNRDGLSPARSISAPARAPRSARSSPKSWEFRRLGSHSSKATPL